MKFFSYSPMAIAPAALGQEFSPHVGLSPAPFDIIGDGLAVVRICGPLVHHRHAQWDSYEAIRARVDAAFDAPEAKAVVLRINSPGGDVDGCFELARELRAMRISHDKPLLAFADGMAASAAYALACTADRVLVPPSGFVGSIGVIEAMVDQTAADAAMGLRFTFVTSGARKADGNPHVTTTEAALGAMQTQVDGLAGMFFSLVEEMRGLSAGAPKALQAGMFFGDAAVAAGLADSVTTWSELVSGKGEETSPMASKKMSEAVATLMAEADGEDEKVAKKARRMLRAMLDEDGDDDGNAPAPAPKKEEASAAAEEKTDEPAAVKAESPDEKKDDKPAAAAAAHQGVDVVALMREVHTMKAEKLAEADARARALVFAKRPDLDATAIAALAGVPTASLQAVVDSFPRAAFNPAAAAAAVGTRGEHQINREASTLPAAEVSFIDTAMGLSRPAGAVRHVGTKLELGILTPAEAAKRLAEIEKGGN